MELEASPIKKTSLADIVYHNIRKHILSQKIKGGEKLFEEDLAKAFEVSRTPIREALRKLQSYGLIKIYPHKYAEVVKLAREDKKYIMDIRVALDLLAITLLSPQATKEDYQAIYCYANLCEEAVANRDIASCFENDSLFHLEISKRTKNQYLYKMQQDLDAKVQLLRTVLYFNIDMIKKGIIHHKPIAQAICLHKTQEAYGLMKTHLNMFYQLDLIK